MNEGQRTSTIDLFKEALKFSAGHFTLFSATERERLHGHDYFVSCAITGRVGEGGLIADYGAFKSRLRVLCEAWDEYLLLPGRSPWLDIEEEGEFTVALFNGQRMPFRTEEVRVLPIANISLEELAWLFLKELVADGGWLAAGSITDITVKVSAGPGQSASASWAAPT